MKIKAVYFGYSVNIENVEKTYLLASDTLQFKLIPELLSIEVLSSHPTKGGSILCPLTNVKYFAFEGELDVSKTEKAQSGSNKKTVTSSPV